MSWEKRVLENAQRWADSGEFDKIVRGAYMSKWEDDLRQEINNAGGFLESEVNDLVMVFQNEIREIMIELNQHILFNKDLDYHKIAELQTNAINKLLSERGIKKI